MESMRADVAATIDAWVEHDPTADAGIADRVLTHLANHPDDWWTKDCPGGHVTASVMLVDPATCRTLLTLHGKFRRWMQLGGHLETIDTTIAGAALREASEESGITGPDLDVVQLLGVGEFGGLHCPSYRSDGVHYDVRFLVVTSTPEAVVASDESLDLRWWPLEALPESADLDVQLLAYQALTAVGGQHRTPRSH